MHEREKRARWSKARLNRLWIAYGLWSAAYVGGDLKGMREGADAFLHYLDGEPDGELTGPAHRVAGVTKWHVGDFEGARRHLEEALARFDPVRDRDLSLHFGQDPGLSAMAYLPLTLWPLGEVVQASSIAEDLVERIDQTAHAASISYGYMHAFCLALVRANSGQAAACAEALAGAIRDHDMDLWRLYATFPQRLGEVASGRGPRRPGRNASQRCLAARPQN